MAQNHQDWEDLGRSIQDIVDRAVNSSDYQKLNQTIRQTVERVVDVSGEAVRKAVDSSVSGHRQRQTVEAKKELPVLYANPNKKTASGILKIVGGGAVSAVTLAGSLATLAMDIMFGVPGGGIGGWIAMAALAGGGLLIGSGVKTLNRVSRFKTYKKTLGEKTYCTLEKLARSVGKSVKFVRRELRQMIDGGLFLEGHMDREQNCLITSDETFRYYEQSRLQLEERQRLEAESRAVREKANHSPQVQEVLDKGNAFIAEIRRCNDLIPGEAVSAKIDRMETIVRRIFDRVQTNPEIVPDLKKMMGYYLPMTVKLLNAYADMDAQPVQGETIRASKLEIEQTLDTLNQAYEKLLDELFADTALDISSDISVLNTLLAQEGLADDDFRKLKNQ